MANGLLSGQAGGNQGQVQYAQGPIYDTELYDPKAPPGKRWSNVGKASNKRLYHSGALLLPSGHVVTVGSEMSNYDDMYPTLKTQCFEDINNIHTGPLAGTGCTDPFNYNIERFTPDYLANGARPIITQAPSTVALGSLIQVDVDNASNVVRVTIIRTSTLTHSTNMDQRFIELVIKAATSTSLYLQFPTNPNQAIPGYWMMYVLDKNGIPSVASTISLQIGSPTTVTIPASATQKSSAISSVEKTLLAMTLAALANLF